MHFLESRPRLQVTGFLLKKLPSLGILIHLAVGNIREATSATRRGVGVGTSRYLEESRIPLLLSQPQAEEERVLAVEKAYTSTGLRTERTCAV